MVSRETTWELHLVPTKDNFYTTMGHIRDIFRTSFEPYVDYLVALSTSALLATYTLLHFYTYTLLHCHNNFMLEGGGGGGFFCGCHTYIEKLYI